MATPSRTAILQKEIDKQRSEIHTDHYSISIGEIVNMYRDGEVDIHPEFQRYYRWTDEQKSRFIESILLGIPIPSMFVAQLADGKWDVIDGLQRLSTILELMGELKDEESKVLDPLTLTRTKYLPSLEGMRWKSSDPKLALSAAQQLFVNCAKLDFKIILRESNETTRFELFQRLNTGGSQLSDQEVRNAMLVAASPKFYRWLLKMADYPSFVSCVSLSDRAYSERFDLELVLRYQVLSRMDIKKAIKIGELGEFLSDEMMNLVPSFEKWGPAAEAAFKETFDLINKTLGGDAFRMYDWGGSRYTRGFSISAFEVIAMGIGYNIQNISGKMQVDRIQNLAKQLWGNTEFLRSSGSGVRASTRIPKTLAIGRELFKF